jgi:hypothetical protein
MKKIGSTLVGVGLVLLAAVIGFTLRKMGL